MPRFPCVLEIVLAEITDTHNPAGSESVLLVDLPYPDPRSTVAGEHKPFGMAHPALDDRHGIIIEWD